MYSSLVLFSQQRTFSLRDFSKGEVEFSEGWKFHTGDSLKWADPFFAAQSWHTIGPELIVSAVSEKVFKNIIWFRLELEIDSSLIGVPLLMRMIHSGASDVYLNGKLIRSFGVPSGNKRDEITFNPRRSPAPIVFSKPGKNVFAIKYSNLSAPFYYTLFNSQLGGFYFLLSDKSTASLPHESADHTATYGVICLFGFLAALSILHGLIYFFYREQISNLYYCLFSLCFAFFFLSNSISALSSNSALWIISDYLRWRIFVASFLLLLWLVYSIVYTAIPGKIKRITKITGNSIILILFLGAHLPAPVIYGLVVFSVTAACTMTGFTISSAIKRKQEGIKIIGRGFQVFVYFAGIFYLISEFYGINLDTASASGILTLILSTAGILSVPISMSAYLAFNFSKTNKNLKIKLQEVETLSAITLEQERERKRMIESQKDDLEVQVKLRTAEVEEQKEELRHKNKEIIDSISYAKRIQDAFLPHEKLVSHIFKEGFVLFKPKDIVSGDFYWVYSEGLAENELTGEIFVAAADCTGHGVPGAIMSVICCNAMNEVVVNKKVSEPGKILDEVRNIVIKSLKGSGGQGAKDGMDIALCKLNLKTNVLKYAGANNPLWIINNFENADKAGVAIQARLTEIKADKMPVGLYENLKPFTTQTISLNKGDMFFVFSDGYADQFGGPKGKKFKYKQLEELLLSSSDLPSENFKAELNNAFESWKGTLEQVDDVLVIGVKV